jgi:transcriptional regulator with XRE-family HTH domain
LTYSLEHIVGALKAARQAKGLSQRELSALAGVPQAHISKIENAAVDLKLSSLVELARVLGLELMLVPRRLVPAVQSMTGAADSAASPAGETRRTMNALKRLRTLLADGIGQSPDLLPHIRQDWEQVQRTVSDLSCPSFGPAEREQLRRVVALVRRAHKHPEREGGLAAVIAEVRALRNRLVHNVGSTPPGAAPAYTLDHEDDDA